MALYSLHLTGDRWIPPPNQEGPARLTPQQKQDSLLYGRRENAHKLTYDSEKKIWKRSSCFVQIAKGPFDRGFTRSVYRVLLSEEESSPGKLHCGKVLDSRILKPLVGNITRQMYFDEAMSLVTSQKYAALFNEREPPQEIQFCDTFLLELVERAGNPLISVEPMLEGSFVKHNNNNGGVLSSRMTPQAFSHFTYHVSNGRILICDIQGCQNTFTDPQIHSSDSKGFGLGNQGQVGFDKFLQTHTCGVVCAAIGLPRLVNGRKRPNWTNQEVIKMMQDIGLEIPPHLGGPSKKEKELQQQQQQQQQQQAPQSSNELMVLNDKLRSLEVLVAEASKTDDLAPQEPDGQESAESPDPDDDDNAKAMTPLTSEDTDSVTRSTTGVSEDFHQARQEVSLLRAELEKKHRLELEFITTRLVRAESAVARLSIASPIDIERIHAAHESELRMLRAEIETISQKRIEQERAHARELCLVQSELHKAQETILAQQSAMEELNKTSSELQRQLSLESEIARAAGGWQQELERAVRHEELRRRDAEQSLQIVEKDLHSIREEYARSAQLILHEQQLRRSTDESNVALKQKLAILESAHTKELQFLSEKLKHSEQLVQKVLQQTASDDRVKLIREREEANALRGRIRDLETLLSQQPDQSNSLRSVSGNSISSRRNSRTDEQQATREQKTQFDQMLEQERQQHSEELSALERKLSEAEKLVNALLTSEPRGEILQLFNRERTLLSQGIESPRKDSPKSKNGRWRKEKNSPRFEKNTVNYTNEKRSPLLSVNGRRPLGCEFTEC